MKEFGNAFPNLVDVFAIQTWQCGVGYDFDGVKITPMPANHSIETAGFLVESSQQKIAYFTDTAGLPEITADRVRGIDMLICDATFYGENWFPDAHMSVKEAIQLGRELKVKRIILTHLSMHYSQPVTFKELERELAEQPDVSIGWDGMRVEI